MKNQIDEGFLDKFFMGIAKGRVDRTMKKMIKDNPEVIDAVKDLRDKQILLEDALKKHYGV